MEAARTRFTFAGEWLTAAAFLVATVLVGALVVRELRMTPRALAAARPAPAAAATTAVPADAVSVPALAVGGGVEIKVGDRAADTIARLDAAVVLKQQVRESGPLGPREVRSYELSGTRFILVLEPFERRGEPRVAAIYLE